MIDYENKAKEYFKQGYNCAQSVVLAFADECNIDKDTLVMLSSSFGAGMGRLREVCGAVTGMFMVAGLKFGYTSPYDSDSKTEHYKRIQQLAEKFMDENRFIICRELLGLGKGKSDFTPEERTQEYYKKRPCVDLVGDAARIMGEYIQEYKKLNS